MHNNNNNNQSKEEDEESKTAEFHRLSSLFSSAVVSSPLSLPILLFALFVNSGSFSSAHHYLSDSPSCRSGHVTAVAGCRSCGDLCCWSVEDDEILRGSDEAAKASLIASRGNSAIISRTLFLHVSIAERLQA